MPHTSRSCYETDERDVIALSSAHIQDCVNADAKPRVLARSESRAEHFYEIRNESNANFKGSVPQAQSRTSTRARYVVPLSHEMIGGILESEAHRHGIYGLDDSMEPGICERALREHLRSPTPEIFSSKGEQGTSKVDLALWSKEEISSSAQA